MLSIVIPCYNGVEYIKLGNVEKVLSYVSSLGIPFEVIVVNDGSRDHSLELLKQISGIRVVTYRTNHGKGYAVREGMKAASGDVLFMDIDLSTDLSAIKEVLKNRNKIVIGSRMLTGSHVEKKPFVRELMSVVSRFVVRFIAGVKEKDTQCGFKYFPKNFTAVIIEKQKIERWAFDVEYLVIAHRHGVPVLEIPVSWNNGDLSCVSPVKSSLTFLKELVAIRLNGRRY